MNDKLTEQLTLKITYDLARKLSGLASLDGIVVGELARNVLTDFAEKREHDYMVLHEIFGNKVNEGNKENDK